jgi:cyclopropane fatty-acyl-phospholipid synthase-like methyltransferase
MIRRLFFEIRYILGLAPWDTGISPPELMRFIEDNPSGRALDIGCGTGTNAITLAERGWQVTGLDFSAQAIARARRKVRNKGLPVEFIQGDVNAFNDLDGPYDLCLDIGCYHSLSLGSQAAYAEHLGHLIPPGGTYLMYSFLRMKDEDLSAWPSEETLRQQFNRRFEIISVEYGSDRHRTSAWFTMRRKT